MSDDVVALLVELADACGAEIVDLWGRSTVTIRNTIDIARLEDLSGRAGFRVQLLFGDADNELTVGSGSPDVGELAVLQGLLANERERSELAAVRTTPEAEQLLHASLTGAFVEYARAGWARTESAFLDAVKRNWVDVVKDTHPGSLNIGPTTVILEQIGGPNPLGGLPVFVARVGQPLSAELNLVLACLADGAAWTRIAVSTRIVDSEVLVALHNDQDAIIRIGLPEVAGGVELLKWRMASDEANREEALRYVLRFVTASSPVLPNARTVRSLAERQRIALVRDRAAEVFRSIADGQRSTAQLLEAAAGSLSKLVEDTTTTASATVAGVIGVVALVAQNANLLPGWLIILATLAAVAGVVAVIASRWRRIADQEQASVRLLERLRNDPLLPAEEMDALTRSIEDSKLRDRAKVARRTIVVLGAAACVVALAASSWLVWVHDPKSAASTPTTTSTSTSSAATRTAPPALPSRQVGKQTFLESPTSMRVRRR